MYDAVPYTSLGLRRCTTTRRGGRGPGPDVVGLWGWRPSGGGEEKEVVAPPSPSERAGGAEVGEAEGCASRGLSLGGWASGSEECHGFEFPVRCVALAPPAPSVDPTPALAAVSASGEVGEGTCRRNEGGGMDCSSVRSYPSASRYVRMLSRCVKKYSSSTSCTRSGDPV